MPLSSNHLGKLIGVSAIVAPTLHTFTDIAEWIVKGFSDPQLWVNYMAFLLIPFMIVGLFAIQRPKIGILGLIGSFLYGISFIYFAHTTIYALTEHIPDYEILWNKLGMVYTINGGLMIVGGIFFGAATYRADIFPRWTSVVFLTGILLNFIVAILPVADLFQTVGSLIRNVGLIGMGIYLVRHAD